jgi:hypothetical protein
MNKYDNAGYYCEDCDEWHLWLDPKACHLQARKKAGKLANAAKELKTIVEKKSVPKGPYITIELLPEEVEEILRTHFEHTIPVFPLAGEVQFYPHQQSTIGDYIYTFKITPPDRYWK